MLVAKERAGLNLPVQVNASDEIVLIDPGPFSFFAARPLLKSAGLQCPLMYLVDFMTSLLLKTLPHIIIVLQEKPATTTYLTVKFIAFLAQALDDSDGSAANGPRFSMLKATKKA